MSRYPLTPEGYAKAVEELRHQKQVVRPGIVKDIEDARAHGDISENSEFEDAKERQSLCEARIKFLEGVVSAAEVIDITKIEPSDRVVFGTTVLIENTESGDERRWRIVGETESDVSSGKISYTSPVGKALIGKEAGDEVKVTTPQGVQTWEIVEVQYLGPDDEA